MTRRSLLISLLILAAASRVGAQVTTYTPYRFTTVAGTPGVVGAHDGTGSAAQFNYPRGVAVDSSGNLYVADALNQTIRMIAPGGVVTTVAGAAGTAGGVNGTGSAARFSAPSGVAVDSSGNLYVADTANYAIRKITAGGVVSTLAGSLGNSGSADGTGTAAQFNAPVGIAIDSSGNLYVADTGNDTIRKVTPAGSVTTLAGSPRVAVDTDGTGSGARFNNPSGIAVGTDGTIYVSDLGVSTIRKVTQAGVVTTIAGGGSGYTDGTGTAARFNTPRGLAVDSAGNIYVADSSNDEVRRITAAGVVTTLAGFGYGSADGVGANAQFNLPYGIAVDSGGTLTVADSNNCTIRSGTAWTAPTFTVAASPASLTVATGRTVYLGAQASGSPAPTYQWTLNGSTTIPGAASTTGATLVITGATSANAGTYTCTAANGAGNAHTSATLAVVATSNPGYLTNLSARAGVGTVGGILIAGFGTSGSGAKQILLRAVGPGLASTFGLTGVLANPQLTLYDSVVPTNPQVIATDTGWGASPVPGPSTLSTSPQKAGATLMATVGAFALVSGSSDSAMVIDAPVGSYTAQVSGVGATTGIALAEIYDADPGPPPARLINISARASVGVGGSILIGGFSIVGSTAETVLIRGVGPGLASTFGLTGTLATPQLTLYDSVVPANPQVIATNAGWGASPVPGPSTVQAGLFAAPASVMTNVGAFSLVTGSADSAMLVTLPPGGYTAQLSGVAGSTGIALVEIYEVQ